MYPPAPQGPVGPPNGPAGPSLQQTEDNDKNILAEVETFYTRTKDERRPHESSWFLNSSMLRGNQHSRFDAIQAKLMTPPMPSHRVRLTINKIRPKIKARVAKFTKNRSVAVVIPASTEREDRLNARATQKVLDYLDRKQGLEQKYKQALLWSQISSKGFWWIFWNADAIGRVKRDIEGMPGQTEIVEAILGDVAFEVGSPFEVLVSDASISSIGDQPAIMRCKLRPVDDIRSRYPEKAEQIKADATPSDGSNYERQIATLSQRNGGDFGGKGEEKSHTHCLVKVYFEKGCSRYPKGRYVVSTGSVLLKVEEELPFGFYDLENPYPVIEFNDSDNVGQYWNTTVIEQLIDIQREYNLVRSMVAEVLKLMARPKILVYKQHQLNKSAWTAEAGEIIEVVGIPGLPPPQILQPANIAPDAWQVINLLKSEFDDLTQIYPATEGKVGTATSGFQTNLLQEAADSVHAPDIRSHELKREEAAIKARRLMKLGYDVPRLITIAGRSYEPEVLEFSKSQIDEAADIIVQAGSALPSLKSARVQSVLELSEKGILGDPNDPEVKRRTLNLLDMGGLESVYEEARRDEDLARRENADIGAGNPLPPAEFFHDHVVHQSIHADQLKSPEVIDWKDEQKLGLIAHLITHADFVNPQMAQQLRIIYHLEGMPPALPPPPMPPSGDPNAPQGPPAGPPPSAPPPAVH